MKSGHELLWPYIEVTASPASVNVLEGYSGDPRTADKLVDGVNLTSDDMHVWLAPFDASPAAAPVTVTVNLDELVTLAGPDKSCLPHHTLYV